VFGAVTGTVHGFLYAEQPMLLPLIVAHTALFGFAAA
jgi:hypothetical protein